MNSSLFVLHSKSLFTYITKQYGNINRRIFLNNKLYGSNCLMSQSFLMPKTLCP